MHPLKRPAAALLLLIAGCGPLDLPTAAGPGAGERFANAPAEAEASWPDPLWWRGFGSAELDALVAEAQANNRDLRASAFRVAQSEAAARIASASLFPLVTAGATASRSQSAVGSGGGRILRNSFSGTLDASWEVDLWGRLRAGAQAGDARLLASRFDQQAIALSITAQTATAYVQLLAQRRRLALARETLGIAQRVLAVVESQAAAGGASELEVQQQRASVAAQLAAVTELEGQERQALDALAVLLGRRPDQLTVGATSLSGLRLPAITAGIPAGLLARRPDLARAETELLAAGFDAQAARAARYPALSLTASGGRQSTELSDLLSPARNAWSIGGSLGATIFDAGELRAGEDAAVARAHELAETYTGTVLTAFQEVEDALAIVGVARRSFELREQAYAAASAAWRIAETRWRAGAADFLSVLTAQQTAFSAADALAEADAARYAAIIALYRALGGGWSANQEEANVR
jgi:NodT family efflux transporter outer membrane factor (OMF) lipoprotein